MKKYTVFTMFLLSIFQVTNGFDFKPEQAPLLKNAKPKYNVFALFDDSKSIVDMKKTVQEHFLGYGLPVCVLPHNWNEIKSDPKYQKGNYYDPFSSGSYVPYDPDKHLGFDGSVFVNECDELGSDKAFQAFLENFLLFYKDKFQLGFGGLSQNNTAAFTLPSNYDERYNVVAESIKNLSEVPSDQWKDIYQSIKSTFQIRKMNEGWSPIFPALYNLSLYFRGYPIPNKSYGTQFGYLYRDFESPLKYRCAKNHIVMFTDGRANRSYIDVFADNDVSLLGTNERGRSLGTAQSHDYLTGEQRTYSSLVAADLSNILLDNFFEELVYVDDGYTGSEDGKVYEHGSKGYDSLDWNRYDVSAESKTKYNMKNETFLKLMDQDLLKSSSVYHPTNDITGKAWSDNGIAQKLTVNAIVFSKEPYQQFLNIIDKTEGKMDYQENNLNYNTIFNKVSDMLVDEHSNFKYNSGYSIEDQYMRTKDTTRFVFYHDIYTNTGGVAAYHLDQDNKWNQEPSWTTDQTVTPQDGQFITMKYDGLGQKSSAPLTLDNIKKVFTSKYAESHLNISYLHWLRGVSALNSGKPDGELSLKTRTSVIGPIVNAKPIFVARDREYINLNFVSDALEAEFEEYVQTKNRSMDNLIIANANDGLVHFIKTEHGNKKGGYRKAAYFPGFLAARLPEIVGLDTPFAYNMDGQTNVFEFKGSNGAIQTVALSGMGGGGKGIVGYRLFKKNQDNSIDKNITPLFEVVNEDGFAFNSPGFSNLGYTYSGFEFVNIASSPDGKAGRGVAVFGNGYGQNKSSVYLIDIETGNLLREIPLSADGGGASTPALIVRKDDATGFQDLYSLLVGDQSGRLYKVEFALNDIVAGAVNITTLYQPERLFENPITVRPMIHSGDTVDSLWVYFGTGRKADLKLDRGDQSKLQQYFVAINLSVAANATRRLSDLAENDFTIIDGVVHMNLAVNDNRTSGWFLKMPGNDGERIVYQPGVTLDSDIVFSTWKLLEGDDDICSDDVGAGLQFALNASTGDIGKFKSYGDNVAGVRADKRSPGVPSGTGISYQGYYSGGLDHGAASTLKLATIDKLNSINLITSHAKSANYLTKCLASTTAEVVGSLPEFCHDFTKKNPTNRRVNIRKRF